MFEHLQTDGEKHLIVIGGATATGKTAAAVLLAQQLGTEVLSADSRQFYREMSIGTAKPTAEELGGVRHHFLDFLSVTEPYSVGDYERDALRVLDDIFRKKKHGDTRRRVGSFPAGGVRWAGQVSENIA